MKFSVIIMTRNRCEDLKFTVRRFLDQTWADKEVIVIDNASDDATAQMMKEFYPEVKYVRLPDNIDVKAFNVGLALTDGDLLWRTDDDSYPQRDNMMEEIANIISKHQDIDIIAMTESQVKRNYSLVNWYGGDIDFTSSPEGGLISHTFFGGGAIIKRKVFDTIGGFWDFGFEELDLSTRAIINGFNIRYFPHLIFEHNASIGNRMTGWRWKQLSRQYIRYQAKYFTGLRGLGRVFQVFIYQMIIGIISLLPIMILIEGALAMLYMAVYARNNERAPIPQHLIKQITLNKSLFKSQMTYFKNVIISRLNKRKKQA